jgi:hypothetical protein
MVRLEGGWGGSNTVTEITENTDVTAIDGYAMGARRPRLWAEEFEVFRLPFQ